MAQPQLDGLTDPGGLFVRLGRLCKIIKENRDAQINDLLSQANNVLTQFENDPNGIHDLDYLPTFERDMYNTRQARNAFNGTIARIAARVILEHVNDTDILPFTDDNTVIEFLIRLMNDKTPTPYTFQRPDITVSDPEAHPDNVGDGTVAVDIKDENGEEYPYTRHEDIDFVLSDDTGAGTMTKFGFPERPDSSNYKWPGGSGSGSQIPVCDPSQDATGGSGANGQNVLVNSDFEDSTANDPDQWEAHNGAFGIEMLISAQAPFGDALVFAHSGGGDGLAKQKFNDVANGTPGILATETWYAVMFWYRSTAGAGPIGSGDFEIRVKIGTNEFTWTKSLADNDWPTTFKFGFLFFKTPRDFGGATGDNYSIYMGIASGGSLTASNFIAVGQMCLTRAIDANNIRMAAAQGSIPFALDDRFTVNIDNAGVHGGGSQGEFQFYMDLVYDMYGKGLKFPDDTVGNETVADSLIA